MFELREQHSSDQDLAVADMTFLRSAFVRQRACGIPNVAHHWVGSLLGTKPSVHRTWRLLWTKVRADQRTDGRTRQTS